MADEVVAAVTTFRSWTYSPLARRRCGTTFSWPRCAPEYRSEVPRIGSSRVAQVFSISLTGRSVGCRPDVSPAYQLRTSRYPPAAYFQPT